MRLLTTICFVLFALLVSGTAKAQSFSSVPSENTTFDYNSTSIFINGTSTTSSKQINLTNLTNSTFYRVILRATTQNYTNSSGSPVNLALTNVIFNSTSVTNNTSSSRNPGSITYSTAVTPVYQLSAPANSPTGTVLIIFKTSSGHRSSDIIRINITMKGLPLVAKGGNGSNLTYGPVQYYYDLYNFGTSGTSSGSLKATSNNSHTGSIRFQDALSFTVNPSNPGETSIVISNVASSTPVIVTSTGQFSLISNENITLTVLASGTNFTPPNGSSAVIPTSTVGIKVNKATSTGNTLNDYTTLNGTTPVTIAPLITRLNAINQLDMSYRVFNPTLLSGKSTGIYQTTLTYRVTQQ